ncbi:MULTISPECIES: hypothetical protein [Rhodopseudomonas]|uniref:Signal peptide protein n=1 Tax=Rhodopseudomonas palustris TaxID=1076 RepID=A0A0D7ETN7_RHOPL|nr:MULTISPECIES: hypothetical protein [Rhodopseudomonas]KIZ44173.1 signal peptide protein [Rhodopseudomonas palustris]WOK19307.1 hypothetical protein RBJ75_07265 [Rhodopseudomonas sp. BAL398]
MRPSQRLISLAVLVALSSALAGCGSMGGFDPTDMFDFLDTKKKLPGDRRPVFPEGVPGLEQGVPKDLYKGSQQEMIDQQNAAAAGATEAAPAPPPEQPKPQRRARVRHKPAAASSAPAPKRERPARRQTATPTAQPSKQPPAQSAAPADDQSSPPPFPAPLPSGSFSR